MKKNYRNHNVTINAVDNKEEKRMNKMKKVGFMTIGTVAAAGAAMGLSSIAAHADTLDAQDSAVKTEAAAPAAAEADTSDTVEQAKQDAEQADADVKAAEDNVASADEQVDDAENDVKEAQDDADKAFDDARSDAEQADADAEKNVDDAKDQVSETGKALDDANTDKEQADADKVKADEDVTQAESNSDVTQDDIDKKENERTEAENSIDEAQDTADAAKEDQVKAEDAVTDKENELLQDKKDETQAEADKTAADDAVKAAQDAADKAAKDEQSAIDYKDGKADITDTTQYKDSETAKKELSDTKSAVDQAKSDVDSAQQDVSDAEAAIDAADKTASDAEDTLSEKKDVVDAAEKTKTDKDAEVKEAQDAADDAASKDDAAKNAVDKALQDKNASDAAVKQTEADKTSADQAVTDAKDAVETAKSDAEKLIASKLAEAEKTVEEKQNVSDQAQKDLDVVEDNYKQGTLGFIDWMLSQADLSKDQKQDLQAARKVLEDASEEEFSQWSGGDNTGLPAERNDKVVVIGDSKDATNLENLKKSITIMNRINQLRASDDNYTGSMQREASSTNFYFIATAEAGAMRGAGLTRHSALTTSCEDLAFGYSDPTAGWYTAEKKEFDRIKSELGITSISSEDDISKIEAQADRENVVVGHYTNLMWSADQVMGVGFTEYGRYGNTSCYNASNASNYTNDQYNRAMHLYTLDEFTDLFNRYYKTVDKLACQTALNQAAQELTDAKDKVTQINASKDATIAEAVKSSSETLAEKIEAADGISSKLTAAKADAAVKGAALSDAETAKASADQELQNADAVLTAAKADAVKADFDLAYAKKECGEAETAVADAKTAVSDAKNNLAKANAELSGKQTVLTAAENTMQKAQTAYDTAAEKLAGLTSDDTIAKLKAETEKADGVLQNAVNNQKDKATAVEDKKGIVTEAETNLALAKTAASDAKKAYDQADEKLSLAKTDLQTIIAELKTMQETYAPVLEALANQDAAVQKSNAADAALDKAKLNYQSAKDNLAAAESARYKAADKLARVSNISVDNAMTVRITDPDFAYLNEYVDAIKAADSKLSDAEKKLSEAKADLESRKTASDAAQKKYIETLADFVIAQNNAGVFDTASAVRYTDGSYDTIYTDTSESSSVIKPAESTNTIFAVSPVKTGDDSNTWAMLAELLASMGLLAVVFKKTAHQRPAKEEKSTKED